jgi:hypothetical protein
VPPDTNVRAKVRIIGLAERVNMDMAFGLLAAHAERSRRSSFVPLRSAFARRPFGRSTNRGTGIAESGKKIQYSGYTVELNETELAHQTRAAAARGIS